MATRLGSQPLTSAQRHARHWRRLASGETPELRESMRLRKERKRLAYQKMIASESPEDREARVARSNEASRRYKATHPQPYRPRPKEQVQAACRRHYLRHRKKILAKAAFYWAQNHDVVCERQRNRYAAEPAYRAKVLLHAQARRSAVANGTLTLEQWLGVYDFYEGHCVYCGKPGKTLDHIVPLVRGGKHSVDNVVPACKSCNSKKRTRTPTEWYQSIGDPHER